MALRIQEVYNLLVQWTASTVHLPVYKNKPKIMEMDTITLLSQHSKGTMKMYNKGKKLKNLECTGKIIEKKKTLLSNIFWFIKI